MGLKHDPTYIFEKKRDMSKDWFISDTHFDHGNIMKYCNRPGLNDAEAASLAASEDFKVSRESIVRMNDMLVDEINSVVMPEDRIWHLGDVLFGNKKYVFENCRGFLNRLKCKEIHLCRGNHDHPAIESLFASVQDVAYIKVGKQKVFVSHYAHAVWDQSHRGRIHLYGHSHSTAEEGLDAMMPGRKSGDIGVDNLAKVFGRYAPIDITQVNDWLGSREGHSIDHHTKEKTKQWLGKDPNVPEEGG
jgi:calcineurin-like phosphoesterase family protein